MGLQAATGEDAGNDTWLTPPTLIKEVGKFDLDPCCPPVMPWRTARLMLSNSDLKRSKKNGLFVDKADGLLHTWRGRVWCNPPFSKPLPWVEKMAKHGDGILLVSARSPDTRWGQRVLATADGIYYLSGRLLFHYEDGTQSTGKWQPNLLAAYGKRNMDALKKLRHGGLFPGVLMVRG